MVKIQDAGPPREAQSKAANARSLDEFWEIERYPRKGPVKIYRGGPENEMNPDRILRRIGSGPLFFCVKLSGCKNSMQMKSYDLYQLLTYDLKSSLDLYLTANIFESGPMPIP